MNICLEKHAKLGKTKYDNLKIIERLPDHVQEPCALDCTLEIQKQQDHFLLQLEVEGDIQVTCQRCSGAFMHAYQNQTQLAICADEMVAEKLMPLYDSMVARYDAVNLIDILTDELHLFLPERHEDETECQAWQSRF